MGHTHRYQIGLKKINQVKSPSAESRFRPGSRLDKLVSEPRFRRFWISLRLRMYLHSNVLA